MLDALNDDVQSHLSTPVLGQCTTRWCPQQTANTLIPEVSPLDMEAEHP